MALGLVFFAYGVQKLGWLDVYSSNRAIEIVPETGRHFGVSVSLSRSRAPRRAKPVVRRKTLAANVRNLSTPGKLRMSISLFPVF